MRARLIGFSALSASALLFPLVASAQTLLDTLERFQVLINTVTVLLVAVAVVVFFWGIIQYLMAQGAEGKAKGLQLMVYGIIALVVMVSVWGIIRLVQRSFITEGGGTPVVPGTITPGTGRSGTSILNIIPGR